MTITRTSHFVIAPDHPAPAGTIHQEQADPVVGRQVAAADVLAITATAGEGEGLLIDHLDAGRDSDVDDGMTWPLRNQTS
jgi:hypothetical protein